MKHESMHHFCGKECRMECCYVLFLWFPPICVFVERMPVNDAHATYHISVKIVRQQILQCAQASDVEEYKSPKAQAHWLLIDRQYQSCQQYLIHSVMSAVFASQNHVLVSLYVFTSNPLNIFSTPPAGPGLMLSSRSPRGRWWRWPRWRVKLWRKPWFLAENGNRIGHWLTRLQR